MGLLLKVILFGLVIYYLIRTIGGFVFRILGGSASNHQQRQTDQHRQEGDVNIDYIPDDQNSGSGRTSARDGDYIDYEEVK